MQSEGEHVDEEWNDDQTDNTSDDVGTESGLKFDFSTAIDLGRMYSITYDWHLGVTELVPEILNGVQTDESSDEKTDELDRADAANAETGEEKPEEPFRLEAVVALVVELGPAENCSHGTAEQHRVEEDESADGRVGVLAENHESDEPDSGTAEVQFLGSEVGKGNADDTEEGVEGTHEGVVELLGIVLTGLEFERAVVTSHDTRETDEHFTERGVDIEVVFVLNVVASEFTEAAMGRVSNVVSFNDVSIRLRWEGETHWASSQVTMSLRPIL